MINPNIFKVRNDWNVKAMMCKRYNYIINGELFDILKIVAKKSKIPIEELLTYTRKREIVEARQIYFKRAKETTKKTLAAIGRLVGKDHSTVYHGIKTVNNIKYMTERYDIYFNGKIPVIKIPEAKVKVNPIIKINEPETTVQKTTFTERPRKAQNDNPLAGSIWHYEHVF